jgi:membrane fusion protein (multidrug efflux system)
MSPSDTQLEIQAYARPFALTLGLEQVLPPYQCNFGIRQAVNAGELLSSLDSAELGVLVLGPRFMPFPAQEILSRLAVQPHGPLAILVGVGPDPEFFQPFVDCGRVYYISRGSLGPEQVWSLISAAMDQYLQRLGSWTDRVEGGLEYCIRLLKQSDRLTLSSLLDEALRKLVGAERAYCLSYDAEKETLSSVDPVTRQERIESAASGLAAFAARTGQRLVVEDVGSDPRYDPEADNPGGAAGDRLIAAPVFGGGRVPIAVLIAVRSGNATPFGPKDVRTVDLLADCAGPSLAAILVQKRVEWSLLTQAQHTDIFRREALDHYARALDNEGDLLGTSPRWLRNAHWMIVALLLVCLVFAVMARVRERATGPAVIRARNKIVVTATMGGLVRSVEVSGGEQVRRGDLLLRFQDTRTEATGDALQEQLRAPTDGVVSDVRVRAGQQISPGDQVASIIDENAGYELIVLFPGQYAPQIRPGMQVIFKVDGYPDSNEAGLIDDVGHEIIGPREAARFADSAETLAVNGPVVIVRSLLKQVHFSAGHTSYVYRDGMTAQVDVNLRSESMIVDLLPGLKEFLRNLK